MALSIVKKGIWLYDGTSEKHVDVISLDYDWWYELAKADEMLEPNETPEPLNEKGVLYYVRFKNANELAEPTWVDSRGFRLINDAVAEAESKVAGKIRWK